MAGGIGNSAGTALFALLFVNTAWANIGNAGGLGASSAAGSFFAELSTGTLTGASTQSTTEAAYTSYARVAIARSSSGFTASGTSPETVSNTAATTFPACTGGSETETYFSVGRDSSSTGMVIAWAPLTASLAVSNGITPSFAIGALVISVI